jgi:hypothetical protein
MLSSNNCVDAERSWAINGRFLSQRMAGVQRYAYEIVAALDAISLQRAMLSVACLHLFFSTKA